MIIFDQYRGNQSIRGRESFDKDKIYSIKDPNDRVYNILFIPKDLSDWANFSPKTHIFSKREEIGSLIRYSKPVSFGLSMAADSIGCDLAIEFDSGPKFRVLQFDGVRDENQWFAVSIGDQRKEDQIDRFMEIESKASWEIDKISTNLDNLPSVISSIRRDISLGKLGI